MFLTERVSLLDRFFSSSDPATPEPGAAAGLRLVVGLGNPGPEYEATRHNVGFDLVDRLARERGLKWEKQHKFRAKICRDASGVIFAKPLTFMNLSGNAVARITLKEGLDPSQILVVYDDTALPVGGLRFRGNGSAGGHNGIKSLLATLGTEEFPRLRIGVGAPPPEVILSDHVLSPFPPGERVEIEKVLEIAAEGVNCALSAGLDAAMNRYNRRN